MKYYVLIALFILLSYSVHVNGDNIIDCIVEELEAVLQQLQSKNWDYIVVGGGAAGSVVATRLSENSANSVLLIEAGGASQTVVGGTDYVAAQYSKTAVGGTIFHTPLTRYDVPSFAGSVNPNVSSNPTEGYQVRTPTGVETPHSRILGGNGVHNNMIWTRATNGTINAWNVTGWSFDELLPYYIKSENVNATHLAAKNINPNFHGRNGPIQLGDPQGMDPSGPAFVQACINANYPANDDFNGPTREGCGYHVFNIDQQGRRASSASAYLPMALNRPNFKLLLNARVTKILFNSAQKAVGVEYMINNTGRTYTVSTNKEVILSMGAINTPKLLMLSGIGLPAILTPLGIPVISNLPVGTRMLSHGGASVAYSYPAADFPSVYNISNIASEYARFGTGWLASAGYFGFGFVKSDPSKVEANILIGTFYSPLDKQIGVQISLHQPVGITNGVLNISSTDINAAPYLYLNVWDNPANVDAVVNAIKIARVIMSTPPASTLFGNETLPGPAYKTDDQLRTYVRGQPGGSNKTHLWGGARLGNVGDNTAVLDPRARVKGVTGLRVCDLSIVPLVLGGHPMSNVVMFGEYISTLIIADNA